MEASVAPAITAMDAGLYRKNVMKTLSVKPAKLGLKLVGSNTEACNIMHVSLGVATEAMEFLNAMRPFMLGEQIGKIDKFGPDGPQIELGDAGYYLAALAKITKTKPVSAKKKYKLKEGSTITTRILDFVQVSANLADIAKKNFYGPPMKLVEKQVRNPKTNEVAPKQVSVVDKEALEKLRADRKAMIVAILKEAMEIHAELCYVILGTPTGPVNLANIKKLTHRFPEGTFELVKAETKSPEKEAVAAQAPAEAATV